MMQGRALGLGVVVAVSTIGLAWLVGRVLPPAYDFHGVYYPAIRAVWAGTFSYAAHPGFLNPPWALALLWPLGVFDGATARALLLIITFGVVAWSLRGVRRWALTTVLCIFSVPMLAVAWLGQIEVFAIAGAALAYRALDQRHWLKLAIALLLLLVKPQETWFLVAGLGAFGLRRIGWRAGLKSAAVVIGTTLVTSLIFGAEWLNRLAGSTERFSAQWQNFSIWRWSEFMPGGWMIVGVAIGLVGLAWAMARLGRLRARLGVAATGSNLLSPYLTGAHLMLTLIFGWSALFDQAPRLGVAVYVLTLTPLLRWGNADQALNRLDALFPIGVAAGWVWLAWRERRRDSLEPRIG